MTFLWHDYETFGTHPAFDRPAQFGAIRTDSGLREIGDPMVWYCKPPRDALPHPGASLVTGITPQDADREGLVEAEFARRINAEMSEPDTSVAGYNNIRFDDEFTRFMLHRNFLEPYTREWANGNSRFDLIDVMRLCYATRPEGIEWPEREPSVPSFRLEDLTAANGIEHGQAHDALADVRATIAMARLVMNAQPKLWHWTLGLRDKKACARWLKPETPAPLFYVSAMIPASRGCMTMVLPLAEQPERPQSVIAYDLSVDPEPLLTLDADAIAERVFTSAGDLPDGVDRIPLMTIACNRLPMIAPAAMAGSFDHERIGLDVDDCLLNARRLAPHIREVRAKLRDVYAPLPPGPPSDVDASLYTGDFFSRHDRALMDQVSRCPPAELSTRRWEFKDPRLPEMLFRYRARNYPETLDEAERERWRADREQRLGLAPAPGQLGFDGFKAALSEARAAASDPAVNEQILDPLSRWVSALQREIEPDKQSNS